MAESTPVKSQKLINEHEAAERLGMSVKTMRRWRWEGRPPEFVKLGRSVRYHPNVIEDFILAGSRRSTSDPGAEAA